VTVAGEDAAGAVVPDGGTTSVVAAVARAGSATTPVTMPSAIAAVVSVAATARRTVREVDWRLLRAAAAAVLIMTERSCGGLCPPCAAPEWTA
jgi:hypothetical protein